MTFRLADDTTINSTTVSLRMLSLSSLPLADPSPLLGMQHGSSRRSNWTGAGRFSSQYITRYHAAPSAKEKGVLEQYRRP